MNPLPSGERYFVFINGILTRPGDHLSWNRLAETWVNIQPNFWRADSYDYYSSALEGLGKLQRHVDRLGEGLVDASYYHNEVRVVAHSKGCHLICEALKQYPKIHLHELHLIAGATSACFNENGLNDAVMAGHVRRVYVYGSHNDRALWLASVSRRLLGWLGLGYGSLGRQGPMNVAPAVLPAMRAGRKDGENWDCRDEYDHSSWLDGGERFQETMRLVTGER